jgi:hypothetical protein
MRNLMLLLLVVMLSVGNTYGACFSGARTIAAHTDPECPDCEAPGSSCPAGVTRIYSQYRVCRPADAGQDGKENCYVRTNQPVGNVYSCETNWDGSVIAGCVVATALCGVVCAIPGVNAAGCVSCFIGVGGACGTLALTCGFVEDCEADTDTELEIRKSIYSMIAGCDCEG